MVSHRKAMYSYLILGPISNPGGSFFLSLFFRGFDANDDAIPLVQGAFHNFG